MTDDCLWLFPFLPCMLIYPVFIIMMAPSSSNHIGSELLSCEIVRIRRSSEYIQILMRYNGVVSDGKERAFSNPSVNIGAEEDPYYLVVLTH